MSLQENCTEPTYFAHMLNLTDQISEPARNYIQNLYDTFLSSVDQKSFLSVVLFYWCLTVSCFWLLGFVYTLLDIFQKPTFLLRYKTHDTIDRHITLHEVIMTAKVVLWNQLTVQFFAASFFHLLTKFRPMDDNNRVPPLGTIIYHIVVFVFVQETSFYYLHRMLHSKLFYRPIHKIHHRWQAPIAIAALYCHPIEHLVANLTPVLLGPLLMGSHLSTIAIWLLIVHIVTINDHSGYHFPLMPSPEFHEYHHLMYNQNYGRMGFLDYFHGTSQRYLKSKYYKRHQVLLSLTPMKVLIPDDDE